LTRSKEPSANAQAATYAVAAWRQTGRPVSFRIARFM